MRFRTEYSTSLKFYSFAMLSAGFYGKEYNRRKSCKLSQKQVAQQGTRIYGPMFLRKPKYLSGSYTDCNNPSIPASIIKLLQMQDEKRKLTFQCISTRSNQQTNKIDIWVVILGNHHFITDSNDGWPGSIKAALSILYCKHTLHIDSRTSQAETDAFPTETEKFRIFPPSSKVSNTAC